MWTTRTVLVGVGGLLLIVWAVGPIAAQTVPGTPQTPQVPAPSTTTPPETPAQPSTSPTENAAATSPADTGQFAQAPAAGTEAAGGFDPSMMGDSFGAIFCHTIQVPTGATVTIVQRGSTGAPITTQVPVFRTELICVPDLTRGTTTKIAEDEAVRPVDRVFADFNYYDSVLGIVNVYAETFGFEKTFLDGNASVGLRVPVLQTNGDGSLGVNDIGDLSVILKYAFINSADLCMSTGLVTTAPTGPAVVFDDGTRIRDTLLQPFLGYFELTGRSWIQAFTSVEVPMDRRDVILMYSDLATGYWVWQRSADRLVSGVAPTVEVHVTTPLDHRERMAEDVISGFDLVDITAGAIIQLHGRSLLSLGVCAPVTGPRPYDVEAIAQFGLRF